MTDYSKLTDYEINKRVASYQYPMHRLEFLDDDEIVLLRYENENFIKKILNYCKSENDARSFMRENEKYEMCFRCSYSFGSAYYSGCYKDFNYQHENLLRVEMILLLMIKDDEND